MTNHSNEILAYCGQPNSSTVITSGVKYFQSNGTADQVVIGDFNGDGKSDVIVVPTSGSGTLYLSTGTALVSAATIDSSWDSEDVVAGDFNGDGKTDIALISQDGTENTILLSSGQFGGGG